MADFPVAFCRCYNMERASGALIGVMAKRAEFLAQR
jgi:hypothetical protein